MNVDSGAFENLAAQVAELAEQIRDLRVLAMELPVAVITAGQLAAALDKASAALEGASVDAAIRAADFAAGVAHGEARVLGKAGRTSAAARPARTAALRPGHLRAVDGGAS